MSNARLTHLSIRPATGPDAPALAALHVAVWQSAYRGIMPDSYLDALSLEQRTQFWTHLLAEPDPDRLVLLLEAENGTLGGFLSAGRPVDLPPGGAAVYRGEVHAMNILPSLQGRGHGRRLLVHAANWLSGRRLTPFFLWVLADNTRARDFYEILGGMPASRRRITIGGAPLTEIAYQFLYPDQIAKLALKAVARR
ncbi:MAG: GNAT family N-acetyltransferase [Ferrovibrio sp.]|nr:GNAT family N-acetyltransferase [Ferrovibrio sp.]